MGLGASEYALSEELRGKVLRWEQEFGALHLERRTGDEVVVPISDRTEITATFAELTDGTILEPGEWVTVSREKSGPLKIMIELPEQDAEITPGEILDEMEPTPSPSPSPTGTPIPAAIPTAPPAAIASPEPTVVPEDTPEEELPADEN